ncbi:GtrA family protein [Novosphingobium sp.]|uniref:GtrA family protein n=1 Tax=Novosphingobium sp. TaxID=1874826 RepID=UPI00352B2FE6
MPPALLSTRALEIFRYYQAAVVNTLFGLSAYALLVWLGMNMFVAQLISHLMGMTFNYFSYSRHVFRASAPAKGRFVLSYGVNYLISLGTLALVSRFIASPFIAGFATTMIVSVINYFALKHLVFKAKTA